MPWHVCAAAAIGRSHVDGGLPCQDAFAHRRTGDVLVAVVCDGAGSQPRSHDGAQALSADVVAALIACIDAGSIATSAAGDAIHACVASTIAQARTTLAQRAQKDGESLSHYAATLVGAILSREGGWFFHVGDGVAVALGDDGSTTVSRPENGEYANETYFVTGEDWEAHLRTLQVPGPIATLAMMSDGAMPFAMAKDLSTPYTPFLDPVARYLASVDEATGAQALHGTLADPRTDTITSDDKTLLVALWR